MQVEKISRVIGMLSTVQPYWLSPTDRSSERTTVRRIRWKIQLFTVHLHAVILSVS